MYAAAGNTGPTSGSSGTTNRPANRASPFDTLSHGEVVDKLRALELFLENSLGPVDLGIFLGVAYDSVHEIFDRRRFRTALQFIVQDTPRDKLVICIDPGFDEENIITLLGTLPPEVEVNHVDISTEKILVKHLGINYSELEDIPFYHIYFPETRKTVTVLFLRYALESKYSEGLGNKISNQINIQEERKELATYIERCEYTYDGMYGILENIARNEKIQQIYFTSSANVHGRGPIQSRNGRYFRAKLSQHFRHKLNWHIENRYLEDFCEVLRLMYTLQILEKSVFYINLDVEFPALQHPTVIPARVPYKVPFLEDTVFHRNSLFREVPSPTGGKRRKTRRQKRKLSTRKKK